MHQKIKSYWNISNYVKEIQDLRNVLTFTVIKKNSSSNWACLKVLVARSLWQRQAIKSCPNMQREPIKDDLAFKPHYSRSLNVKRTHHLKHLENPSSDMGRAGQRVGWVDREGWGMKWGRSQTIRRQRSLVLYKIIQCSLGQRQGWLTGPRNYNSSSVDWVGRQGWLTGPRNYKCS